MLYRHTPLHRGLSRLNRHKASRMFAQINFYSMIFLPVAAVAFAATALLGKAARRRQDKLGRVADDELKIVLGATLSLFALLIGFMLSFAISGYNNRVQAEENEAFAIGHAFQRSALLDTAHQPQAQDMLKDYLNLRISFYAADDTEERLQSRLQSIQLQTRMWLLVSEMAKQNPSIVLNSLLDACNELYTAQQKTLSSWRRQIPTPAWVMLILFALCSNFLIGYNARGVRGNNLLIITFPALIALSLFMIAEIDVPGEGLIHATPDNLKTLRELIALPHLEP